MISLWGRKIIYWRPGHPAKRMMMMMMHAKQDNHSEYKSLRKTSHTPWNLTPHKPRHTASWWLYHYPEVASPSHQRIYCHIIITCTTWTPPLTRCTKPKKTKKKKQAPFVQNLPWNWFLSTVALSYFPVRRWGRRQMRELALSKNKGLWRCKNKLTSQVCQSPEQWEEMLRQIMSLHLQSEIDVLELSARYWCLKCSREKTRLRRRLRRLKM